MIHAGLLEILVCPETKQTLSLADSATLDAVNADISRGAVKTRAGEAVSATLEAALVRSDGRVLYPIREDIPVLLIDESIELDLAND